MTRIADMRIILVMTKVISDNSSACNVIRIDYTQIGLNESENALILSQTPEDEFVRATAEYQICADRSEHLDSTIQPNLSKFMQGPFALAISNLGDTIEKSMLVFEIVRLEQFQKANEFILDDPKDWTSKSLAAIPFLDVFKKQIEHEAHRSLDLINASKVRNLQDVRARKNLDLAESMTRSFMYNLDQRKDSKTTTNTTGKEAVLDSLASSLCGSNAFYNTLWSQMTHFYEPSFRYIGEQHALGNISLEPPRPIFI